MKSEDFPPVLYLISVALLVVATFFPWINYNSPEGKTRMLLIDATSIYGFLFYIGAIGLIYTAIKKNYLNSFFGLLSLGIVFLGVNAYKNNLNGIQVQFMADKVAEFDIGYIFAIGGGICSMIGFIISGIIDFTSSNNNIIE